MDVEEREVGARTGVRLPPPPRLTLKGKPCIFVSMNTNTSPTIAPVRYQHELARGFKVLQAKYGRALQALKDAREERDQMQELIVKVSKSDSPLAREARNLLNTLASK